MEVHGRIKLERYMDNCEDILCEPCQYDGSDTLAKGYCETCNEYFCLSCLKLHCRQSISRTHVIMYGDNMPRSLEDTPCSQTCTLHNTEIVKFYCQRHNYVGCNNCMIVDHKQCKVQLVAEVSSNYGNSKELDLIRKKIANLTVEIASCKQKISNTRNSAQEMKNELIKEIKTFREDLNDYLDEVEAELLDSVEEINAIDVMLKMKFKDQLETMETEIKEIGSQLDHSTDQSCQLFVMAKLTETRLGIFTADLADITKQIPVDKYKFNPSTDLTLLIQSLAPIGSIDLQSQEETYQSSDSVCEISPQIVGKIRVREETEEDCWITGMTMISSHEILLADCFNKSLKILNVTKAEITSMIMPDGKPIDVTTINSDTAATTLTDKGKILFVNTRNGLSIEHALKVRDNCKGIDYHNGLLLVSSCSQPPVVQILNMKGQILQEIINTGIFKHPCYVAFSDDGKNVYVSDFGKNTVYKLNSDENLKLLKKYEHLNRPSGLAVTNTGSMFVCCVGKDCVGLIDSSRSEVFPLGTQYLQKPVSILVNEEMNYMYVSENKGTNHSNYIKIFKIK